MPRREVTESFVNAVSGDPVGGIRDGNRLPTSPELQAAGTAAYNFSFGSLESYVRLTWQYVGSSYTQLNDQEPGFGIIRESPVPGESPGVARRHSSTWAT